MSVHRVNVILDEVAWKALQEIPRGDRSKMVSQAVKQFAQAKRRQEAANRMDARRKKMSTVLTEEIVAWVRRDRQR